VTSAEWLGVLVLSLIIFAAPSHKKVVTCSKGKRKVKYKESKEWLELKGMAMLLAVLWAMVKLGVMPDMGELYK
jgi:hypothetical protein